MKNSTIIILEVKVKEEKINELQNLLSEYLPETRKYKGFIDIKIHKNLADNTFVFYEEWETTQDYEAYLKWRTDTGVMDALGNTFSSPPNIRYWNTLNL
ncbi:antibiotic biosynthesis monooxygenase [Tenacibaculum sp. Bg11-29]|uniref:putative quinol monooxygenase n=1 Tax=Tenacibaculum sp. Bg11-29 TaxID=2058306 RepID=UPI000C34ED3D|nr:antibiotic biosynthesis monooxygenase family protein [Tenacibaculum sp. Bg11-29]PKH52468.1 antibiotic biosynthesis monooxygenase [Tenacibaculum sp. Bg11-29]